VAHYCRWPAENVRNKLNAAEGKTLWPNNKPLVNQIRRKKKEKKKRVENKTLVILKK